jgi:Leucine-rich repeat (LRR) protein
MEKLFELTGIRTEAKLLELKVLNLSSKNSKKLQYAKLIILPKEIGKLINLKELCLSHNKLTRLPKEIGDLINLETLWINNNELFIIPKEIGNLVNLKYLFLHDNQLFSLPQSILELNNLKNLTIDKSLKSNPVVLQLLLEDRVKVELV